MTVGLAEQVVQVWALIILALAVTGLIVAVVVLLEREPPSAPVGQKKRVRAWCVRNQSWGVRAGGLVCTIGALSVLVWVPAGCTGTKKSACPSYSIDEPWILRSERAALVLVVALFIVAILWYVLVKGMMPSTFGFSTATVGFAVAQTSDTVTQLADQQKTAQETTAAVLRRMDAKIDDLESRVGDLE
jgi:hypothetical protein